MANLRPLFLRWDLPIQQQIDIPAGWERASLRLCDIRKILVSILLQLIINQPSSINYIHLNLHNHCCWWFKYSFKSPQDPINQILVEQSPITNHQTTGASNAAATQNSKISLNPNKSHVIPMKSPKNTKYIPNEITKIPITSSSNHSRITQKTPNLHQITLKSPSNP